MRLPPVVLAISFLCIAPPIFGQSGIVDYQARILTHVQCVKPGKKVGFAGWGILPDATQTRPFRGLVVAGGVYKAGSRWVELMGGTFVDTNGRIDPLINIRASERTSKRLKLFGEFQYVFQARRILLGANVTVPVRLKGFAFEIGVETDNFHTPKGWTSGFGPRIVVPLPICKWLCQSASLALAWQHPVLADPQDKRADIVRSYLLFNF